jgi:hypothetical protein
MATWDTTLRLKDFYHDDELTIAQKAEKVSNALIAKFSTILDSDKDNFDEDLDSLVTDFQSLSAFDKVEANHFDNIMSDLYDWADWNRVWIETR